MFYHKKPIKIEEIGLIDNDSHTRALQPKQKQKAKVITTIGVASTHMFFLLFYYYFVKISELVKATPYL